MPIISKIEAKTVKGKLLYASIFFVLTLGAVTMIYPFAIMVSGSIRSEMDETDLDLIPSFLVNEDTLYRKFTETKYNQSVQLLNRSLLQQNFNFRSVPIPGEVRSAELRDFRTFLMDGELPRFWTALGGTHGIRTRPENQKILQDRLAQKFDNNVASFAAEVGGVVASWSIINLPAPEWMSQRFDFVDNPLYRVYFAMAEEAPPSELILMSVSGYFLETMIYPVYGSRITENYNEAFQDPLESYSDFRISRTLPETDPLMQELWLDFVRNELHPSFVRLEGGQSSEYREFLVERYAEIDQLNETWGTAFASFDDISLPERQWLPGSQGQDYRDFFLEFPPERWILTGPEFAWRDFLLSEHESLEGINEAIGTSYASLEEILPPMSQLEYDYVTNNSGSLRWTYSTRNYINVLGELFLRGRAFMNTVIYCFLCVTAALLVNPMAAYAMSRFRLPGTYKILMILMATISFPPMVTTIPQFIILRETNMLNTFVALVLPAIANGYLVFLLKGFFDSLPRELYEAATIDGASEMRIFFQITMSLSKPILAVVALGAFNSAYGAFLYPLIVAPSQDMWVLNVWLYQWQQTASTSAMFASVLIASIPTLIVFLIAQNIIMRGIVVPTEK